MSAAIEQSRGPSPFKEAYELFIPLSLILFDTPVPTMHMLSAQACIARHALHFCKQRQAVHKDSHLSYKRPDEFPVSRFSVKHGAYIARIWSEIIKKNQSDFPPQLPAIH